MSNMPSGGFNYDPANISVMQDDEVHARPTRANIVSSRSRLLNFMLLIQEYSLKPSPTSSKVLKQETT